MESFFSTVKSELTDRFASFSEAKMELFDYIVVFYNQRRRHSTFGRSARPPPNDVGLPRSDHDGRSVAANPHRQTSTGRPRSARQLSTTTAGHVRRTYLIATDLTNLSTESDQA